MILICLLYTCGVWIESVDTVADLCLTNQVSTEQFYPVLLNNLSRTRYLSSSLWVQELPGVALRAYRKINQDCRTHLVSSNRDRFAHYRYYTNISHSLYVWGPINASSGFGLWPLGQNPAGAIMTIPLKSVF